MMRIARKLLGLAVCGGLAANLGCQKSDTEALANIGAKIAERTHDLPDVVQQKWAVLPGRLALENRVKSRLRWDKALAESAIDVAAQEQKVELKGKVASADLARRAMELAETTVGVDSVVNSLSIDSQ